MSDESRKPLIPLAEAERVRRLRARGLDSNLLPLTLTPEEQKAAQDPGLPAKKVVMTPGFKTSEFWLSILAKAAIACLSYLAVVGGPIEQIAGAVAANGGFLALVAPLAKTALLALFGFLISRLSAKYAENRTELKISALEASK